MSVEIVLSYTIAECVCGWYWYVSSVWVCMCLSGFFTNSTLSIIHQYVLKLLANSMLSIIILVLSASAIFHMLLHVRPGLQRSPKGELLVIAGVRLFTHQIM